MSVDHDLIKAVHHVDGILSVEDTQRRIRECLANPYPFDRRCAAIAKFLSRKSKRLNGTEARILKEFPVEGINLGNVSNSFLFASGLRRRSIREHKAIVSLAGQGYLAIIKGWRVDSSHCAGQEEIEILVRI